METTCISCNENILNVAVFCQKCGGQQKCRECKAHLVKGANNCIECGASLKIAFANPNQAVNTIEFNETPASRSYKVAFTNEVGANVVEVVKSMLESQMSGNQLKLEPKNNNSNHNENKTVDAQPEDITILQNPQKTFVKSEQILTEDILHIDDVKKNLECSESHWMLVFAFYTSVYGRDFFSKETIQQIYKNNRDSGSRMSNFIKNWNSLFKTNNRLIKTIKENEFMLTAKGIETAKMLIKGEIISKPSNEISSKNKLSKKSEPKAITAKSNKTTAKSVKLEQFDIFKSSKKSALDEYLRERAVNEKSADLILAFAYYMTKYCGLSGFSDGNIEYAFKALKKTPPLYLRQTITNCKTKNMWFRNNENGNWTLERKGENDFEKNFPIKP